MPIYMNFDGIEGDVTAEKYEKWVSLDSFQWGAGRGVNTEVGRVANRDTTAPSVSEVTLTKKVDCASPYLFQELVKGFHGKKVLIDFVNTQGKAYLHFELESVLMSSYSLSSGGERPGESLALNFVKLEMKYTGYDADHKVQAPLPVTFDLTKVSLK